MVVSPLRCRTDPLDHAVTRSHLSWQTVKWTQGPGMILPIPSKDLPAGRDIRLQEGLLGCCNLIKLAVASLQPPAPGDQTIQGRGETISEKVEALWNLGESRMEAR